MGQNAQDPSSAKFFQSKLVACPVQINGKGQGSAFGLSEERGKSLFTSLWVNAGLIADSLWPFHDCTCHACLTANSYHKQGKL